MSIRISPIAIFFMILLFCGVYAWYLFGFSLSEKLSETSFLDLIFTRFTIGIPFVAVGALFFLRPAIKNLSEPSIVNYSILFFLLIMGADLLIRFMGIAGREPPYYHTLYLGLRVTLIIWFWGMTNYKISHKELICIIGTYVAASVLISHFGPTVVFKSYANYQGYIDWMASRFTGLSYNTNMFAGILLTITSIHVLINARSSWRNKSAILLSLLLVVLAVLGKGRYGLLTSSVIGLVWIDVLLGDRFKKHISWTGVMLVFTFIIVSIRIFIVPFSTTPPFINTNASFYRVAHEPNLKLALTSNGIGATNLEQKKKYPKSSYVAFEDKVFEHLSEKGRLEQKNKVYTPPHTIFLTILLDYGAGALVMFLFLNGLLIVGYIRTFGFGLETQVLVLTFSRYFHQQMSIASWSLLMFELAFLHRAQRIQKNSIQNND